MDARSIARLGQDNVRARRDSDQASSSTSRANRSEYAMKAMRCKKEVETYKRKASDESLGNEAQRLTFNVKDAVRRDNLMPAPNEKREEVKGQGQWKCWLPAAHLRAAFAPPITTATEIAREFGGGSGHAGEVMDSVAEFIMDTYTTEARKVLEPDQEHKMLIYSIVMDDTKFKVHPNEESAKPWPLFASQGLLKWKTCDGIDREECIIHPPAPLASTRAASMWAHLNSDIMPVTPMLNAECAALRGTIFMNDSVRANILVGKYLTDKLKSDHKHFTAMVSCKNHQTGLCVAPPTVFLDILGPTFCLSRALADGPTWQKVRDAAFHIISKELEVVEECERSEEDNEYATQLLEKTFFARDATDHNVDDPEVESIMEADIERRRTGNQLIEALPGDWRGQSE